MINNNKITSCRNTQTRDQLWWEKDAASLSCFNEPNTGRSCESVEEASSKSFGTKTEEDENDDFFVVTAPPTTDSGVTLASKMSIFFAATAPLTADSGVTLAPNIGWNMHQCRFNHASTREYNPQPFTYLC